jgi:hypothetical protein
MAALLSATMAKTEFEADLLNAAIQAESYREFLARVLELKSTAEGRSNLAAFSRRAGFSSRSFVHEVLDGRRRLTAKSYPKVERALALPPRIRSHFKLLVSLEENDLNLERLNQEQIRAKLALHRHRFLTELEAKRNQAQFVEFVIRGRELLDCFAALGESNVGATLEEVMSRTGHTTMICQNVLTHFVRNKVAELKGERYIARNPMLIFNGLGRNLGAKECYLQTIGEIKRKATASFHGEDRAFYQAVISIDRHKMPALKQRLWDVFNEFVQESETETGNAVAKFLVGFYI